MATNSPARVFCLGNGVSKFYAPPPPAKSTGAGGQAASSPAILEEAAAAARSALKDADVDFGDVDAAVCGFVYSDSTAGQAVIYRLGLTGIAVYNVNNNCATGSTALSLARALIASGQHQCVLALGFEELDAEGLKLGYPQHDVFGKHFATLNAIGVRQGPSMGMNIAAAYVAAAKTHNAKHGTSKEHFATISHKNRVHGEQNPQAVLHGTQAPSREAILEAPALGKGSPLTFAMLAPLACGAAAGLLCSERYLQKKKRAGTGEGFVEIVGQALRTDTAASFDTEDKSQALANIVGYDISRQAATAAFAQAEMKPQDVDVVEIHDAFASNELAMYGALGLCKDDGQGALGAFVESGTWRDNGQGSKLFHYPRQGGGSYVVNASGGLSSKGHPIGATGIAQCAELCWQLRGVSGKRQVPGAKVALQHNYGWASTAVVTLYRRVTVESIQAKL
eukprot:TRINITY_DN16675_c0_g1_i2.p1 TRINITY_DN16675_c0_g1~~TRINITY_DN16675_c0_g1_i2.p1  ORF type:complete len:476 (+),score=88.20 TRINITY_DN16675_c0_g1_i2:77-1429(+)